MDKKRIQFRLLIVTAAAMGAAVFDIPAQAAVSLADSYRAALKRSEVIADQQQLIIQAEEQYKQATGSLFPAINFLAQQTWQEPPAPGFTAFTPSTQPLVKFSASQPLFRGFREFAGIRQTRTLVDAQSMTALNAQILLYGDVATNFYLILFLEQDLRNLAGQSALLDKRVRELRDRVKIGRSRVSEVLTVEVTQTTLLAQIEQNRGQLAAARVVYAFLTGLSEESPLEDRQPPMGSPGPVNGYLERLDQRPDVQAAKARSVASEDGVTIAKGAHLPSVDMYGNYYLKRFGPAERVHWDLQLALTMPIFQGGVIQSQVRQAASVYTQSELNLELARRQADSQIRRLYQNLLSDQAQLVTQTRAVELSERNYKQQSQDYRYGLVTNLDVLQALSAFQESQRGRDRMENAVKLDWVNLENAVGRIPDPGKGG